jgi:2-succinyl-6-hydroxy-2,4-cyclohexadiene-1-carboxylate synthase
MMHLWKQLMELNIPVQLIAGEYDKKYVEINQRMKERMPGSSIEIIQSSGHITHLERPAEFVSLINRFLQNF